VARNVVRRRIEFNQTDVEWFERTYPDGSLSAVVSMLLEKFREVNEFTPVHYANMAAKALTEELSAK